MKKYQRWSFAQSFFACVFIVCAQAGDSNLEFKLKSTAMACVVKHKADILKISTIVVVLDISRCPPAGLSVDTLIAAKDTTSIPKTPEIDSKGLYDSLLILPRTKLECFFNEVEKVANVRSDPVTINISSCGQ